jgi:TnsA endonuclease N terminal
MAMETSMPALPAYPGKLIGIRFCGPEQVRIRKIVMRSRSRATGKFPSSKLLRMIQWESINELNAFRLAECMPTVTHYSEQPCEISYFSQDGGEARHYPDLIVTINGLRELWEVKTRADANSNEVRYRTQILTAALPQLGFQYRIKLAEDLARQPRLDNACLLLEFGRGPVTQVERWQFGKLLEKSPTLRWGDACTGLYGPRGREVLCRLTLEGVLSLEMHERLTDATEFMASAEAHKWDI